MKRKLIIITFLLAFGIGAWATGGTISGNGSQADPYLLADAADWAVFTTESKHATYWASGVYVKMTADIGTNVNPVTTKVGTYSHMFQGVFDGDGHTLTVSLTGGEHTAPFYYVENARIMRLRCDEGRNLFLFTLDCYIILSTVDDNFGVFAFVVLHFDFVLFSVDCEFKFLHCLVILSN